MDSEFRSWCFVDKSGPQNQLKSLQSEGNLPSCIHWEFCIIEFSKAKVHK